MTTQTIGIKEFRQNMSKLHKKAQKENIRYIVMNHQTPVWTAEPINEDQLILEKYGKQIEQSLKEFERGEFSTLEEVMARTRRRKK